MGLIFRKMKNKIFLMCKVLFVLHIIYVCALEIAYLVPHRLIERNIIESSKILNEEGLYPIPIPINRVYVKWDNWTVAVLYNIFWNEDKWSLTRFVPNWRSKTNEKPIETLDRAIKTGISEHYAYSRYWLGSVTYLRPLTVFFNLTQIRILLNFISIATLTFIAFLMSKKLSLIDALTFVLLLFSNGFMICAMCPTYCNDIFVMFAGIWVLLLLAKNEEVLKKIEGVFLLAIGSLTMYFSFFSFPVVTLGVCLIVLEAIKNRMGVRERYSILILLKNSFCWCCGYGITMVSKSLISKAFGYTSGSVQRVFDYIGDYGIGQRIEIVKLRFAGNYGYYNLNVTITFTLIIAIIFAYGLVRKQIKFVFKPVEIAYYVFVAFLPFACHFVIASHARIHGAQSALHIISAYAILRIVITTFLNREYCHKKSCKKHILPCSFISMCKGE